MSWAQFIWLVSYCFPTIVGIVLARMTIPQTDIKHQILFWILSGLISFTLYKLFFSKKRLPHIGVTTEDCVNEVIKWWVLPFVLGKLLVLPLQVGIKLAAWSTPMHPYSVGILWGLLLYLFLVVSLVYSRLKVKRRSCRKD